MISVRAFPGLASAPRLSIDFVFGSGGGEVLACRGWHFHVSPCSSSSCHLPSVSHILIPHSLSCSSWEFFVGLQYELSVIRGRRPYMWTIWVCYSLLFGHVPGANHPSEKIYSFTRVCTLISVILNMLALDSSRPIDCQVRIVSPGPSYARADHASIKLWVIFLAVSHLFLIKIYD